MFSEIIIAALFLVNYGHVEGGPNPLTINGGSDREIADYTFLVSVLTEGRHSRGSIITPTYIFTVAQGVYDKRPDQVHVRVGSSSPTEGGLEIGVSKIIPHSHFFPETEWHDICLLQLQDTLQYGDTIGPVLVHQVIERPFPSDTVIKAIGFGEIINEEGNLVYTNTLKEAVLLIEDNATCRDKYETILRNQICAATPGIILSNRDVGSPVLYKQQLIGMVSLTDAASNEYVAERRRGYTILVRVPYYLDFLRENDTIEP